MVYTKLLREYCLQNKGIVFDISKEYKEHFSMIPYKTYCKILNRLAEEHILTKESHRAYIVSNTKSKKDDVLKYYTNNGHGIVIGYSMYNSLGVSEHKDEFVEIYTNLLANHQKTIGKYRLYSFDIEIFTEQYKNLIFALELIEKGPYIKDCNESVRLSLIEYYLKDYSDLLFEFIIKAHEYNYSTICSLQRILTDVLRRGCNCITIYLKFCWRENK